MFKTGSIHKVEVKNFVTYSFVEMYPGPNLNMIIGPNGTGKSTIVAAIILGLGGNPKIVGRGHKISEYVKHNCQEAKIQIFLQGERENDFIKITRVFNVEDKSVWYINDKKSLVKDVVDYIKRYNIQVDNLCQFLPQDRVQDFAKLNQKQLLRETQLALCRNDLIEKQELLIKYYENYKELTKAIDNNSAKLQQNRDANLRLEGKIENFGRKKKFLERIQHIERKIAWLSYEEVYARLAEAKEDLRRATEIYEKHRNTAKPLEKEIQQAKKLITDLQNANSNVTRAMRDSDTSTRHVLEKIDHSKDKIRDIESTMNQELAVIDQKRQEIQNMALKIEEMKQAQKELLKKCGSDEQVQQKIKKINGEMQKFQRHLSELQNQKDELISQRQTKIAQIRALRNEQQRLENVKQQRLTHLERIDRDAYEAVLWLRNNKHLFQGEVFEPIMLELNVLDPKNAIYVENVIPFRDGVAFTCTNKQDMNNLIRCLRDEKKLTVNVLYAGDKNVTPFHPNIPIEQLRKYGFFTYLHSLFTAPEPIMRYLCKSYRVHNIPIGNHVTNQHFQDVPSGIGLFFSDTVRYAVSYSKYTNTKSTRQNDITSNGNFSISLDLLHLENLKGQIQEIENSTANCDTHIKEFNNQINLINENITKIGDELKYIHSIKSQVQASEGRIVAMQRRVEEMRQSAPNGDEIRAQAANRIKGVVRGMRQLVVDMKTNYKALTVLRVKSSLFSVKIENARKQAAYLENKIEETRRLVQESEAVMNRVKEAYADIKGQAKGLLKTAKSLSKEFTPEDEGFNEFREVYESLSRDFEVLLDEKQQLTARIECLNTADDDEMREYEERVQMIENLQESIEKANVDLSKIMSKMEQVQEEWLNPLHHLVAEINANFSSAFESMGCAGEVSIKPGDDEKEFASYGLSIKVTYRNGEPLQELNNVTQSGGERAVATAVFMLALQELTPVPFRCVDEINQGMDADNERRIFDLLVAKTGREATSQYFLVTPKLVPNLKFSKSMMIHVVHNGPFIEQDKKWGMSRLCNPKRIQIH